MLLQHVSSYSYGEKVAVLNEDKDRVSLSVSYGVLAKVLSKFDVPWQYVEVHNTSCSQHVSLPVNYVHRPELLAEVKAALLAPRSDVTAVGDPVLALTGVVKMNALHGMGGIGKTVVRASFMR